MRITEKKSDPKSALIAREPHKIMGKKVIVTLVFLAIAGLAATTGYYYKQYQKVKNNPNSIAQDETKILLGQIAKIIDLPDEQPTIATISDKDKLTDQNFFKKTENGDKVLIYAGAKEAILYRPSSNKIIQVAPLLLDQNAEGQTSQDDGQTQPSAAASSDNSNKNGLNVAINNGTTTAGLASNTETKLSGTSGINVIAKGNAARSDYAKTIVVDITKRNTALLGEIASAVGGEVGILPDGESAPDGADVLIIVGK